MFFQLRKKTAESSKPHQQAVSIYINMQIMWIFRYLDFYSRYSRCIDHIYIYTLYISVLCRCIWFYDTYITHNDTRNQFLAESRFQGPVREPGGLGVTGRLVAQLPGTSHGHRICQPREGGNEMEWTADSFVKKHDKKSVTIRRLRRWWNWECQKEEARRMWRIWRIWCGRINFSCIRFGM